MNKTSILIIFMFAFLFGNAQNGLYINEVCSSNDQSLFDEDGDSPDWIELFNSSNDTIDLSNYHLSDDADNPIKWQLPSVLLPPGAYWVVFASGKDRTRTIEHWETPLSGDSSWKFLNPIDNSDPNYDYLNWSEPNFDDSQWEWGKGAFGTGYESIVTESSDELCCIFLRNEFILNDTSKVLAMSIHAYFDDGFTVFLNGYEILREHMIRDGKKPPLFMSAFPTHTSIIDSGDPPQRFDIKPNIFNNLLRNGRNVIALQNHNFWNYFPLVIKPWLSIAMSDTSIQTIPFDTNLSVPFFKNHTNFGISSSGEKLYLTTEYGNIIQEMDVPHLKNDNSFGFHPNFEDSLVLFDQPTPNGVNSVSTFLGYIADTCHLSNIPGYYEDSVLVNVENLNSDFKAFLTFDGSLPNSNSFEYDTVFWIDSTVVIRAVFVSDSLLQGPVSNYSYFINDSLNLPVISMISSPDNFFDNETGIYVKGSSHWPSYPYFEANYWQRWERPIHLQAFDSTANFEWQQNAGVKIHGNYTRVLPQKSFGFYAKSKYGDSRFQQDLFPHKPFLNSSKRFLLRNAGNDNYLGHMRDLLIQTRMAIADLDVQTGYPVSTYLNGDYWGLYHLREKVDRFSIADNHGVEPDSVDLLEMNGIIVSGNRNEFEALIDFLKINDLDDPNNYDYITENIDIQNWIDLYIVNLYHHNLDWPHHNSKFWKAPGKKWRQILIDQDVTMGMYSDNRPQSNPLESIHNDSLSYLAIFYKELLNNDVFNRQYANRFADLMNTIFLESEYLPIFDKLKNEMQIEMYRHCDRWNMSYNGWLSGSNTSRISDFIKERSPYMRSFLSERYQWGAYDTLVLSVSPEGKGRIKLNTITITDNNWQGLYFDSIPVAMEAIPNPGFEFVGWESPTSPGLADSGRIIHTYYLKSFDNIKALFYSPSGIEDTLDIAITEFNYREWEYASTGDWVEIYNREQDTIDLKNWILRGSKPYQVWEIPYSFKLAPEAFIVLVQDTLAFKKWHPDIPFIGPFAFDFDENRGGEIRLYDDLDRLVSNLSYDVKDPWPFNSKSSQTIELAQIISDYSNPINWQLGCAGGTPVSPPQDCQIIYPLTITEIKYNSHPNYETGDWFEIKNTGTEPLQISNWLVQDNNDNNLKQLPTNLTLNSNEYILFVQDTSLFFEFYEIEGKWFGPTRFGLSNQGESIQLKNHFGQEVLNLVYDVQLPWPDNAGSNGFTIELDDESSDMHQGENWLANCFLGTPWANKEICIKAESIIISEVKYQSTPDSVSGDWIELYNTNNRSVDLLNWQIVVSGDTLKIDTTLIIEADEYRVIISDSSQFYSIYNPSVIAYEIGFFDLKKDEESISILDPYKFPGHILQYNHNFNWPVFAADTNNKTLELLDYSNPYLASNWRAGCVLGTPGLDPSWCNTEGIYEYDNLFNLKVSPVPANNQLQLQFEVKKPDHIALEIFDSQSVLIENRAINIPISGLHTYILNTKSYSNGMYFIRLTNSKTSVETKFIILKK
jgi:hypothetical protein